MRMRERERLCLLKSLLHEDFMILTPCTGFHVVTSYKDGNPKNLLSFLYNLSYLLPIYYILSDYIYTMTMMVPRQAVWSLHKSWTSNPIFLPPGKVTPWAGSIGTWDHTVDGSEIHPENHLAMIFKKCKIMGCLPYQLVICRMSEPSTVSSSIHCMEFL